MVITHVLGSHSTCMFYCRYRNVE